MGRNNALLIAGLQNDRTCAIAASYEAKAYGIRTGTLVREAKRLCPELKLVPARHDYYVEYHHRIADALDSLDGRLASQTDDGDDEG